jgi:hypothetical protein
MTENGILAKYYLIFLLSAYEIFLCVKKGFPKKISKKLKIQQHGILKRITFASEMERIS